jgi:hypothetical protein
MRIIAGIWLFYKKLIIPALSISVMIGFLGLMISNSISFNWVGISYIILIPLFQYFIYEVRNPNEYYFYYNMGLNKFILWVSTMVISLFICLIIILI